MTIEDQILKEVRDVKKGVGENAIALARVEGDIKLHTSQIERNTSDIAKHDQSRRDSDRRLHLRIEKVDGRLNKILLKVTGAATAAGAAASALMSRINGG